MASPPLSSQVLEHTYATPHGLLIKPMALKNHTDTVAKVNFKATTSTVENNTKTPSVKTKPVTIGIILASLSGLIILGGTLGFYLKKGRPKMSLPKEMPVSPTQKLFSAQDFVDGQNTALGFIAGGIFTGFIAFIERLVENPFDQGKALGYAEGRSDAYFHYIQDRIIPFIVPTGTSPRHRSPFPGRVIGEV